MVAEMLIYKIRLQLNLDNALHQQKICSESKNTITRQKNRHENLKIQNEPFDVKIHSHSNPFDKKNACSVRN